VPHNGLVEGIVLRAGPGENVRFMRATTTLVHSFFLEASLLENLDFKCYLVGGYIAAIRNKSL
jgi:hypothetical protein